MTQMPQIAGVKNNQGAALQVADWDFDNAVNVAYTASSVATNDEIDPGLYMLVATTTCHLSKGAAPTATTDKGILPAGVAVPWLNTKSQKVAAIRNADSGTLSIIPAL